MESTLTLDCKTFMLSHLYGGDHDDDGEDENKSCYELESIQKPSSGLHLPFAKFL